MAHFYEIIFLHHYMDVTVFSRLLRKRFKWGGTDSQKTEKFCFLPYNPLYLKA